MMPQTRGDPGALCPCTFAHSRDTGRTPSERKTFLDPVASLAIVPVPRKTARARELRLGDFPDILSEERAPMNGV